MAPKLSFVNWQLDSSLINLTSDLILTLELEVKGTYTNRGDKQKEHRQQAKTYTKGGMLS